MKKQLLLSICIFLAFTTKAQWVNIPDSNFGRWLQSNFPNCVTGNYNTGFLLDTNCNDIHSVQSLYVSDIYTDFKLNGIEFFDRLIGLQIENGKITELKKFPNSLENLTIFSDIDSNALENLPNSLKQLIMAGYDSKLIIPSLPNQLNNLSINFYNIDTLPFLPFSLKTLDIHNCHFSKLSHINIDSIEYLNCSGNPIDTIDLPTHYSLKHLYCGFNNCPPPKIA